MSPVSNRRTKVVVALLCGLLGFTAVAQAQQRVEDPLTGLRQADLIRLLDELTQRTDQLLADRDTLQTELAGLQSAVVDNEAAVAAAEARLQALSIQAGTVPVQGPGVSATITDPLNRLSAQTFVSLIEELRNAGAEAIEVNGIRVSGRSYFTRSDAQIMIDHVPISSPYTITAIGNGNAISVALEMPGGIMSAIRNMGASATVTQEDMITISSVVDLQELSHATVDDTP